MVNDLFKFRFLFVFIIILYLSLNITAFNIEKINTEIIVYKEGFLEIKDTIFFINVDKSEEIILPLISVLDLNINSNLRDLRYSYDLNNLKIVASDCCFLDNSFVLEVNYLTTHFIEKKENNHFDINYYSFFKEYISKLNLFLPEDSLIISFSEDFSKVNVVDDRFVVSLEEISNFSINYSIKEKPENKTTFYYVVIVVLLILIILFLYLKLLKKYL
jgi:hypothetical protein